MYSEHYLEILVPVLLVVCILADHKLFENQMFVKSYIYTVEPLLKDTPNKGHNRFDLSQILWSL